MKRRLQNLALALISLCFLLSPIVFSSSAFAESSGQPNANSDPALLRKCIEKVDSLVKTNGPRAEYYGTKGQLLEWLHKPASAIVEYNKALRLAPKDSAFFAGRARAHRSMQHWKEALSDYNSAMSFGLKSSETYVGRALTRLSMAKYAAALSDANSALLISQNDSSAWFAKGNAELELGRAGDSVKSLSKAIELRPDEPAFFEIRSQAYSKLGDAKRASEDLASLKQISKSIK